MGHIVSLALPLALWYLDPDMEATTVPLRPESKIPAVTWSGRAKGESAPDRPDTKGRAILTGHRTTAGGLSVLVLDVDVKGGGFERLEQLEGVLGVLPETRTVRTPSGGLHMYFRHADAFRSVGRVNIRGIPPLPDPRDPTGKTKLAGLDVRAEGGIVVAPAVEGDPNDRGYRVEDDLPIAVLPADWAAVLPRAHASAAPVEVEPVSIDLSTLRQRLADTAKGKRGDGWVAMRHAAKGERMISIDGGPPGAPLVQGVDEFMSKRIVFALTSCEHDGHAWYRVSPEDAAQLFEPSLAILRQDVHALGGESRFTAEHFARKWNAAAQKVAGLVAETASAALAVETTKQEAAERLDQGIPLIVQVDNAFFVLDDRDRQVYEGPMTASVVSGICAKLWGETRPLVKEDAKGNLRPMDAVEIREAYGTACMRLVTEYSATAPRVDDLLLVNCLAYPPVDPEEDPKVAEWLRVLGGERHETLLDWIVWSAPEKCVAAIPALAMVGGSHVGKGLLADSLAKCAGQVTSSPLKAILGQFRYLLNAGPVVFGDEGLPSVGSSNKPATEEFRSLMTTTDHLVELKGLDKRLLVKGGVRCILAANRADRLFSNPGQLSSHDVSAITRRLCVIDIEGDEKIEQLKTLSGALGSYELDPARAIRVARHLRWLQLTRECRPPEPCSGSIDRALRMGGDMAATALAALEDASGVVDWIAADEEAGTLWVQTEPFQLRVEAKTAAVVFRALSSYVKAKSEKYRAHPVTGASLDRRVRWIGFDLTKLRTDGIDV